MTPDLYYLSLTALLGSVLWIGHVVAIAITHGLHGAKEYREAKIQDLPDWGQRTMRANLNMVEHFAFFATAVLVAHESGMANSITATASAVFFWSRLAYTIVFYFGWPYIRTILFNVSWLAVVAIFWQILF